MVMFAIVTIGVLHMLTDWGNGTAFTAENLHELDYVTVLRDSGASKDFISDVDILQHVIRLRKIFLSKPLQDDFLAFRKNGQAHNPVYREQAAHGNTETMRIMNRTNYTV